MQTPEIKATQLKHIFNKQNWITCRKGRIQYRIEKVLFQKKIWLLIDFSRYIYSDAVT